MENKLTHFGCVRRKIRPQFSVYVISRALSRRRIVFPNFPSFYYYYKNLSFIFERKSKKEVYAMKFSCEKETLLGLIGTASRAVTGKSAMPLLEGLLVTAEPGTLTITGYDLSMGIRTTAEADVIEPGSVVLNARLFYDIVRKLPSDAVYLETDDKLLTTIKCGRAVFNLIATEADEYPALAEVSDETCFTLPQAMLKSMIAQTIFSVSDNESKPIHTGCLFELEGNQLNVVAVDGYRLSVRREKVEGIPGDMKFVVPGSSLREIERILTEEDGDVDIFPDRKNILFRIGGTTLITRLIDGEFLNYRAAIPAEFDYAVGIDRHEFITCIERVSLIVSEKLKNPVRFHFDGSYVQMSCITAVGKSYDECSLGGNIDDLEIGFNNRYLLDALRAAGDDQVKMQLKGALNPVVLSPMEGDKYTYLVLPVRLKAND